MKSSPECLCGSNFICLVALALSFGKRNPSICQTNVSQRGIFFFNYLRATWSIFCRHVIRYLPKQQKQELLQLQTCLNAAVFVIDLQVLLHCLCPWEGIHCGHSNSQSILVCVHEHVWCSCKCWVRVGQWHCGKHGDPCGKFLDKIILCNQEPQGWTQTRYRTQRTTRP